MKLHTVKLSYASATCIHAYMHTFINTNITQVARLASKLPDACAEAANDMTGAKPTRKKGAFVIEAHELENSRARNDDDEEEQDDLC